MDFFEIQLLEYKVKKLTALKIEFQKNRPLFWEKRSYEQTLNLIEKKLKEYNDSLIKEYIKLEEK